MGTNEAELEWRQLELARSELGRMLKQKHNLHALTIDLK